MEEEKLKRRLVIEEAMPVEKKRLNPIGVFLLLVFFLAAVLCVLEKFKITNFIDFI